MVGEWDAGLRGPSDLVITCADGIIHARTSVIAAGAPQFLQQHARRPPDGGSAFEISADESMSVLVTFIKMLYSEWAQKVGWDNAELLLELADKYAAQGVKEACKLFLESDQARAEEEELPWHDDSGKILTAAATECGASLVGATTDRLLLISRMQSPRPSGACSWRTPTACRAPLTCWPGA
jgi:hypothetical protein